MLIKYKGLYIHVYQVSQVDDANPTSLLLGTAVLFQAGVILRYISYFKELNVSMAIIEYIHFRI